MNIKELKEILKDADDDAIVIVSEKLGLGNQAQYVRIGITNKEVEISCGY